MRDVIIGIQEDIERGLLTFQQIANKHQVPLEWVDIACGELMQNRHENWYDEQYEIDY